MDSSSLVWNDEEVRYLRAVLRWQAASPHDEEKRRAAAEARKKAPIGEFRVLVMGAKGTGKTSILTRFGQGTFRGENEPPDPFYERGCRQTVEIEGQHYMVDALEMPSKHLSSNPMLEQALAITEAAVLVYDIKEPGSLKLAKGLAEFIRDTVGSREYGLMLVGNKSDVDDENRRVSWAEGSKTAAGLKVQASSVCSFMEVSAKTGDNITKMFPQLGKEVLKIKWLNKQRLEQAERMMKLRQSQLSPTSPTKRKLGLWKSLTTPFFKR